MAVARQCQACSSEAFRNYPHCPECMRRLLKAGLCKWCGVGGRVQGKMKTKDYCAACLTGAITVADSRRSMLNTERGGRLRTTDHRENIYETKYGVNR